MSAPITPSITVTTKTVVTGVQLNLTLEGANKLVDYLYRAEHQADMTIFPRHREDIQSEIRWFREHLEETIKKATNDSQAT